RLPAVCEAYQHGISLGVLSKAWGLAGLRIGWLATQRQDILDAVAVVKDYNSICASAPSETMARVALARSECILARNRQICKANRDAFAAFFSRWSTLFSWLLPQGGSIAFPHLTELGVLRWGNAARLAEQLVEETGVLLLPGSMYGDDFSAHFRIGLGRKMVMQGLSVFEDWLVQQHR
ncbi:MAG: aminotransferase class I/II-fold pyridoxal phosphate-dependent enzyme, partial [Spirochaetales bacterium]|nr:aminotransferase class I/II-fold pyridoxal phosphate-dependent enzyme [Spirochaetales bacterium]